MYEKRYYKIIPPKLDIYKKEKPAVYEIPEEFLKARNLLLKKLDSFEYLNSFEHQFLKALITEFNKKLRQNDKAETVIAGVIKYWLFAGR